VKVLFQKAPTGGLLAGSFPPLQRDITHHPDLLSVSRRDMVSEGAGKDWSDIAGCAHMSLQLMHCSATHKLMGYASFHMQNLISLHILSTVIPFTGRQGSGEVPDEAVHPPGKSCDTVQFTSRHARAVTFATLERVLKAYWYFDPASRTKVMLSPGCSRTIALVLRP